MTESRWKCIPIFLFVCCFDISFWIFNKSKNNSTKHTTNQIQKCLLNNMRKKAFCLIFADRYYIMNTIIYDFYMMYDWKHHICSVQFWNMGCFTHFLPFTSAEWKERVLLASAMAHGRTWMAYILMLLWQREFHIWIWAHALTHSFHTHTTPILYINHKLHGRHMVHRVFCMLKVKRETKHNNNNNKKCEEKPIDRASVISYIFYLYIFDSVENLFDG